MTTMIDAVRRQNELTKKALAGIATDAERAELDGLTAKLDIATTATGNANAVPSDLATMTAPEFEKFLADEQDALAKAPDIDRLALLADNIAAVRKQGVKGVNFFAVRVPVVEKRDPIDVVLARLDEMEKKFDQRFRTGVGQPRVSEKPVPAPTPDPAPEPAPEVPPEAAALAEKADPLSKAGIDGMLSFSTVDELIAIVESITAKMADEADDSDDVRKLLDGTYDLAHLAACAATVAQKAADLVEAAQALDVAKAGRVKKPFTPFKPGENSPEDQEEDEEGPTKSPEEDLSAEEDDAAAGKGKPAKKEDEEPEVEKASDFAWPEDMAGKEQSPSERFQELKRACGQRKR